MNRKYLIPTFAVASLLIGHHGAWGQPSTGSHIMEAGGKMPQSVVWYSEPTEITDIGLLLQAGEKQKALEKARSYVAKLKNVEGGEARVRRYYGLNALCAALTSMGEYGEAIKTCSDAIEIFPTRWQALNNRGVAYYASRQIDKARQDYQEALSHATDSEPVTDLIKHNIALAETKK